MPLCTANSRKTANDLLPPARLLEGAAIPQDADLTLMASKVTNKDVAHAIVQAAEHGFPGEETHFDVIALSTHGYGGLQRGATGSVTGRVLNTTRLPVLVVRPTKLSS